MPFSYLQPKRILALRLAQIIGTSQATLETAYTGNWSSMLDGAEIPKTAFKDAILYIAKEIAQTIGNNPSHPARSFLYCRTEDLSDGDSTPTVDNNGIEIVGVWDSCAEVDTNIPLTWVPTQTISDCRNSFFNDLSVYYYNITGNQIRCTRPVVYLQGCSWDDDGQGDLYDIDGQCPLPESLEALLCDGVSERAAQVGWVDGANVVPYYGSLYERGLASLANYGQSNIPLASRLNTAAG